MSATIKYDVVISFAGENRDIALNIASSLESKGISIFYDDFEKSDLWGKDLYEHFISVYRDNSKYCLMLISEYYIEKSWTSLERKAAQARAFRESKEYILPLKLDDTEIPSMLETTGHIDYRNESIESISSLISKKLWGDLESDKGLELLKPQLEDLYIRTMLVCELSFLPKEHHSRGQVGLVPELLAKGKLMLLKLRSDLQINSPNIDRLVLSQLTKAMDSFDNLLERARFLFNLQNPDYLGYYFISETPEEDFNFVYDLLNKMKLFEGYLIKRKRHFTPGEIIKNWKIAEKENTRYCSTLLMYARQDKLIPLFFNVTTLKNFSDKHLKDGDMARVFITP